MCVQLFTGHGPHQVQPNVAHEQFDAYLLWLQRVATDEGNSKSGGGLFSMVANKLSRRVAFPIKSVQCASQAEIISHLFLFRLQLLANVLYLFLAQQMTGSSQAPRLQAGQPVMNSRINGFRGLQSQKAFLEWSDTLAEVAAPYFIQAVDYCLIDADNLLRRLAQQLFPGETILQEIE